MSFPQIEDSGVADLFSAEGSAADASANAPFLLDDPALVSRVDAGSVEVFSVDLDDGLPTGARQHIFTAPQGALLFGMEVAGQRCALLAVGQSETRLRRLSLAALKRSASQEPGREQVAAALRNWALAVGANPAEVDQVLAADTDSWWKALPHMHASLLTREADKRQHSNVEAHERVRARAGWDREARDGATAALRSIFEGSKVARAGLADSSFVAACRIVCTAQKIDLKLRDERISAMTGVPDVEAFGEAAGLRIRKVALRGEWWTGSHGPLLGFTGAENAPVALLPRYHGGYELQDPASPGPPVRVGSLLGSTVGRTAWTFYRPLPHRALKVIDLINFTRVGSAADVSGIIGLALVVGLLGLAIPWSTGLIFDQIIPSADYRQLSHLVLGLFLIALGSGSFQFCRNLVLLRSEGRMESQLQAALFDRVLSLPVDFFRQFTAGDLADRAGTVDAVRQLVAGGFMGTLLGALFSLLSLSLLFYYQSKLALIACGLALVAAAITVGTSVARLKFKRRLIALQGRGASLVLQLLTGIAKLRATGTENHAFAVWAARFSEQRRVAFEARSFETALESFVSAFPVISTAVIYFALFPVAEKGAHALSPGIFLGFMAAFGTFVGGVVGLSEAAMQLGILPLLIERIKPILDAVPEDTGVGQKSPDLTGAIELSNVTYRYSPEDPLVLKGISLSIRPGEFVAFVGPSGSGKSTLLRLLLGFGRPEAGAIHYDGEDLAKLELGSMRRQIGVVLQNGKLLPGSILTNIIGARPLLESDAWHAAELAGLSDEIRKMPMGMQTVVGAGLAAFSGGQEQRLMIARAIASKPSLLFFDEATSALDNRTQAHVAASLAALRATRVVIAHRLSTVLGADRIFVIANGELVQQGNYQTLAAEPGLFAELVRRQQTEGTPAA
jgi:NHLM bacteriocin system ABC transporter ATP-binding protein